MVPTGSFPRARCDNLPADEAYSIEIELCMSIFIPDIINPCIIFSPRLPMGSYIYSL